jgi:hypothetical protein
MGADAHAKLVSLSDVIAADRDQAAITNFPFAMQLKQTFVLTPIPRAKSSASQYHNHWILLL